ncbi:unnamed protein product [Amoebophrya sp. A120]|nr:unnamed protein product [Amoebophrya sp. A120]|eukprot:GSA120T00007963001.1
MPTIGSPSPFSGFGRRYRYFCQQRRTSPSSFLFPKISATPLPAYRTSVPSCGELPLNRLSFSTRTTPQEERITANLLPTTLLPAPQPGDNMLEAGAVASSADYIGGDETGPDILQDNPLGVEDGEGHSEDKLRGYTFFKQNCLYKEMDSYFSRKKPGAATRTSCTGAEPNEKPDLAVPTYEYIAVVDFECNCIPNGNRDPAWADPKWQIPGFVNEVIEFPTVVLRRKQVAATKAQHENEDCEDDYIVFERTSTTSECGADSAEVLSPEGKTRDILEPVAEFHEYVRPTRFPVITPFCTHLTGISQTQVDAADPFLRVANRWLAEFMPRFPNCLLLTCGDWDFRSCLPSQLALAAAGQFPSKNRARKVITHWCNVKEAYQLASGRKAKGMTELLDQLKLPLVGKHHSGIDDCRNLAKCCQKMIEQFGKDCFFCTSTTDDREK